MYRVEAFRLVYIILHILSLNIFRHLSTLSIYSILASHRIGIPHPDILAPVCLRVANIERCFMLVLRCSGTPRKPPRPIPILRLSRRLRRGSASRALEAGVNSRQQNQASEAKAKAKAEAEAEK